MTPRHSRILQTLYSVDADDWITFGTYVSLSSLGLQNAKASQHPRPFATASRRYLQATFATGDVFPQWDINSLAIEYVRSYEAVGAWDDRLDVLEDAVMHYVFALEALLTGDVREAIAEKVAVSAALLIGRGDDEAVAVRALVKKAYDCRSKLVHGQELKEPVEIAKLRRVCQRVLAVVLSLYAEHPTLDLATLLRELPVSHERQQRVEAAREHMLPLLGDDSSLSES